MKRFNFRLEPVLSLKNHQEHTAKMEVAKAMQALFDCGQRIDMLKKDSNLAASDLDARTQAGISAEDMRVFTTYLTRLDRLITHEETRKKLLRKQLDDKQRVLKQKMIEKKTLVTLKEKKKDAYYQEMDKLLQKESDDMTAIRRKEELPDGNRTV